MCGESVRAINIYTVLHTTEKNIDFGQSFIQKKGLTKQYKNLFMIYYDLLK